MKILNNLSRRVPNAGRYAVLSGFLLAGLDSYFQHSNSSETQRVTSVTQSDMDQKMSKLWQYVSHQSDEISKLKSENQFFRGVLIANYPSLQYINPVAK